MRDDAALRAVLRDSVWLAQTPHEFRELVRDRSTLRRWKLAGPAGHDCPVAALIVHEEWEEQG